MPYATHSLAVVSCSKFGVLRHVGLLLPDGRVAHCTPHRGEHISTVEEFAGGQDVRIEYPIPSEQVTAALQRLSDALRAPKAYNVLTNNCEAFLNRLLGRPATSPQLAGVMAVIGLTALISFAGE